MYNYTAQEKDVKFVDKDFKCISFSYESEKTKQKKNLFYNANE